MKLSPQRFVIDTAAVAAEKFDDETVVLHFESGRYFSLGGAASWIWQAFERPSDVATLAAAAPGGASGPALADIERFVAELEALKLLLPVSGGAASAPLAPAPELWAAPSLEVFSDLSDLIALDPVHEVDAMMGWPRRPDPGIG